MVRETAATPQGAGGCTIGQAAVGGPHLTTAPITTGVLSDFGIQVAVEGEALVPGTPLELNVGEMYEITVTSDDDYKGVLVNTAAPQTLLIPGENTQEAFVCTAVGAVGITHFDASLKTSSSGDIQSDIAQTVDIGVTVVVTIEDGSQYYFSPFQLIFADGTDAPGANVTDAPVAAPTADANVTLAPVAAPTADGNVTDSPVAAPTVADGNATAPSAPSAPSAPTADGNFTATEGPTATPVAFGSTDSPVAAPPTYTFPPTISGSAATTPMVIVLSSALAVVASFLW
jgi:hypothetical protein